MGILKFASADTARVDLGDGDFIELRKDMSKREFNELMGKMPNRELSEGNGLTLQEGLEFQKALFEALVTGWSIPEPATVENYLALERAAAEAIDAKLIDHFGALAPTKDEQSKVSTSRASRRREPLPRA
jgi:hypothetical protein